MITGASSGFGRQVALALAERGASVVLFARSLSGLEATAAMVTALGGRALPVVGDVLDHTSMRHAVEAAESELGPIDILVNDAGSLSCIGPLWEADPSAWWVDIETSLRGTFLGCHAVLPGMIERRSGRIINLTGGGAFSPVPYLSGYAAAKTAIIRLTDSLASELVGLGPLTFCFTPGPLATDMGAFLRTSDAGKRWLPTLASVPVGDGIAAAAMLARLASGDADVLNGRCITVGDDLDALISDGRRIVEDDLHTLRLRRS